MLGEDNSQAKAARDVIVTLEKQVAALETPPTQSENIAGELKVVQGKALKAIFRFYCQQQMLVGSNPTFDSISMSTNHWNIGKFNKFCVDFGIAGKNTNTQRKLTREELTKVYRDYSNTTTQLMDYDHFIAALDRLAETLYNHTYDSIHNTNVASKHISDKRMLLYLDLHLEDHKYLNSKMRRFGHAFSNEQDGSRLPDYDLAKKYRFRNRTAEKRGLQEWRNKKNNSSSNITSSSTFSVVNQDKIMESELPSDAVAYKRSPEKYGEIYQLKHNMTSFTWQALTSMQYSDINLGDDIGAAIGVKTGDLADGLLEQQYHLGKYSTSTSPPSVTQQSIAINQTAASEPLPTNPTEKKLVKLMKLHDEKVQRGMKALNRTSSKSLNTSIAKGRHK